MNYTESPHPFTQIGHIIEKVQEEEQEDNEDIKIKESIWETLKNSLLNCNYES